MDYCSVHDTNIARAFLLQKKMIRIITGNEYRAHSEPFCASELLTIPDLFNLNSYLNFITNYPINSCRNISMDTRCHTR